MSDTTVELEVTQVPVGLIDPNPWNPNVQSEVVRRATRESLERFGFVEPVLLRPKGDRFEIVNGEHRCTEAQALGLVTIPAVVRDLSDDDAKKLTVVLNETTGEADVVLLGRLLADLSSLDDFQVGLPYTEAELNHLLSIGAADWDKFDAPLGDPEPLPASPVEHEVVLQMSDEEGEQFRLWTGVLAKEWQISGGVTAIVWEAVRRAALAASQGP